MFLDDVLVAVPVVVAKAPYFLGKTILAGENDVISVSLSITRHHVNLFKSSTF